VLQKRASETVKPDYDYGFHTVPQKQYVILLDDEIEIKNFTG
jgi:hypothetical protein